MSQSTVIIDTLRGHPWFRDCSDSLLAEALGGCEVMRYCEGDLIRGSDDRPFLCIFLSGRAEVYTRDEGADLLLRTLGKGDTFGVANLFGQAPMVTRVVAVSDVEVVCMREDTMRYILEHDPRVAMCYIDFLADRVRFLNRRLTCLGAGSAQRRLAVWLDSVAPEGAEEYTVTMSMSRLADTLGLGRASLYRAFDELCEAGLIERCGKRIRFLSRDDLRR